MKGVLLKKFGSVEEALQYSEKIEKPSIEKDSNFCLVELKYSGFNHLDTKLRRGYMPQMKVKILGIEYAGVITEVGSKVKGFNVGDRVFGMSMPIMSCYAEILKVDAKTMVKIPEKVSFKEACGYPVMIMTVWQTFKKMGDLLNYKVNDYALYKESKSLDMLKDKVVAIPGVSGCIGMAYLLISKYVFGAKKVIGTCSKKNHETVKAMGCDVVLDYKEKEHVDAMMKENPSFILDSYGGFENMELFSEKKPKEVVYITPGVPDGVNPGEFIKKISEKDNMSFVGHQKIPSELEMVTKLFVRFNLVGKIPYKEFDLKDAGKCHDDYHNKRPNGKMVLKIK